MLCPHFTSPITLKNSLLSYISVYLTIVSVKVTTIFLQSCSFQGQIRASDTVFESTAVFVFCRATVCGSETTSYIQFCKKYPKDIMLKYNCGKKKKISQPYGYSIILYKNLINLKLADIGCTYCQRYK